jgi:hypothetical protein
MGILGDEYKKAMEQSAQEGADGDREFDELEDGFYLAKLEKAVLGDRVGPSGFKSVRLQWRMIKPNRNRVQSEFVSLSPKAAWKMREIFDAAGYTPDSDLEELVEEQEVVILQIEQAPVEAGQRKGEMRADVVAHYDKDDATYKALIGK